MLPESADEITEQGDETPEQADETPAGHGRWWRFGLISVLAAGVVLAGSLVDGELRLPGADLGGGADGVAVTGAPAGAPVTSSALACAGALGPEDETVRLAYAQAPAELLEPLRGAGGGQAGGSGSAELLVTGGASERSATGASPVATEPGEVVLAPDEGALVLGDGGAAPGLAAGQRSLSDAPGARWLAVAGCPQPAEEQWLVGGDGDPGRAEQIVLSNPGEDAVSVEVEVWGDEGPVPVTGASGLVVPGHGRVTHRLDALAPGAGSPVVRVTATGGPLVAHLVDRWREGTIDLGAETVSSAIPGTDLVVPALPRGPEDDHPVTLRLLAPSDQPSVVDLTALTAEGGIPLASHVTSLEPGEVQDVALSELPHGTTGIRVRASTPVVAGAVVAVAPTSDEPVTDQGEASTAPGDDEAVTAEPDDETAAAGSDEDVSTAEPDDEASTARPDEEATTAGPEDDDRGEPVVRPAGELAWVAAVPLSTSPLGIGIPSSADVPGELVATLAVSAVDATTATVHWVRADGGTTSEELDLANDTTVSLPVPVDALAVWVAPGGMVPGDGAPGDGEVAVGRSGIMASLQVVGQDGRGPYLSATTVPGVPWQRVVTEVGVVIP